MAIIAADVFAIVGGAVHGIIAIQQWMHAYSACTGQTQGQTHAHEAADPSDPPLAASKAWFKASSAVESAEHEKNMTAIV
jgi:hypothetical protein